MHTHKTSLKVRNSCPGRKSPTGSWRTDQKLQGKAGNCAGASGATLKGGTRKPRLSRTTVGVGECAWRSKKMRQNDGAPAMKSSWTGEQGEMGNASCELRPRVGYWEGRYWRMRSLRREKDSWWAKRIKRPKVHVPVHPGHTPSFQHVLVCVQQEESLCHPCTT